jgi:hypothetical protein
MRACARCGQAIAGAQEWNSQPKAISEIALEWNLEVEEEPRRKIQRRS